MDSLRPEASGEWDGMSSARLSLISICLAELRQDIVRLIGSAWAEPARRRTHELASTLQEACARQGLEELAGLARSMASLAGLPHKEAAALRSALREKFEELLGLAQGLVSRYSRPMRSPRPSPPVWALGFDIRAGD